MASSDAQGAAPEADGQSIVGNVGDDATLSDSPSMDDPSAADASNANPSDASLANAEDTGTSPGKSGDASVADATSPSQDATVHPIDSGAPVIDAGTRTDASLRSDSGAAQCQQDTDCVAASCHAIACVQGKCTSTPYGFLVSHFSVSGTPIAFSAASQGVAPAHAPLPIAAAYPYVFVATSTGVSAINVRNPLVPSQPITPSGLPPSTLPPVHAVVASGSLVYFVSSVTTTPNGSNQTLAWTDIQTDVSASGGQTLLQAHTAAQLFLIPPPSVPSDQTGTTLDSLFNIVPDGTSGLFLTYYSNNHSTYYPTVFTSTPPNGTTLVPYWNEALVTGADLVVASGSRLIAYTYDGPQPKFALVTDPGKATVAVGKQYTVPTYTAHQAAFASNANGSVLWTSAPLANNISDLASAIVTLLVPSAKTSDLAAIQTADPTTYVLLENYLSPPATTPVVVPPAWVTGTAANGAAVAVGFAAHFDSAAPGASATGTAAHVLFATGAALSGAPVSAAFLDAAPSTLSVASSGEFVYAFAAGAAGSATSTVYVLAPHCAQ